MQDWHYIATGTMDVTIEVNDEKFPNARELSRLWREHRGGIFAAATVATRGALRGFVRDGATGEPIANAALAVEGVEFPFAPNALGFFARPVSGPGAEGDEERDGRHAVARPPPSPGNRRRGADRHGGSGGRRGPGVRDGARSGGARRRRGAARSRSLCPSGSQGESRSGEKAASGWGNVSPAGDRTGDRGLAGPFHPGWGGAAFVILAAAATIRKRRARTAREGVSE